MKKILCFGEILLRLSPDAGGSWLKRQMMPVFLGGAELNVASALARWEIPVAYCSAMPDNYMSRSIKEEIASKNIDVSKMITSGNRTGIYYLAQGTDLKNAEVIYDRAASSTADLQRGQINWDELLENISWFHFSAISPAISSNLNEVCLEALEAAKKKNITISVDLNYRSKLWKWGSQPIDVMPALVQHCNIVMGNIWAAELMLGIEIDKDFLKDKPHYVEQSSLSSKKIMERFPACEMVANTFRFDKGDALQYYATAWHNSKIYVSQEHTATAIADKVGSGDCFMAGLIYGKMNNLDEQQMIDFAAAAAVDKMFVVGDATTSSVETVMKRKSAAEKLQ